MAFTQPSIKGSQRKDTRTHTGSVSKRRKMVTRLRGKYGDNCHWCQKIMVFEGDGPLRATLEHVIPLNAGGLDNFNNLRLAHKKCNHERGDQMPELKGAR